MLKLLSVELLKIRRSLALLMMVVIPLMVVLLNVLIMVRQHELHRVSADHWNLYWYGSSGLWCYFMLPLYIALITGLLNGQEHRNQTWRMMLALPVSQTQLFIVKGVLAWLFVIGASTIMALGATLGAGLLVLFGATAQGAVEFATLPFLAKIAVSCLPVVAIQHAVSWRFQNIVLPLAIGVIATMGITQIGSSSSWVYYPWAYSLMAINGSQGAHQDQALMLSAAVGGVLFALGAAVLGRREVEQ